MKKTITITILSLIMLSGTIAYYAGEPISITLPHDYEYYSIVGNSTPINLEIFQEGLELTIIFDKYQTTDTFELLFFDINSEVVHHYGGGGSTRYIDRNITVEVPKYIEKNIETPEETIALEPEETIVEVEKVNWIRNLVAFCLGMIFLLLLIILYNKLTESDDEYEYQR